MVDCAREPLIHRGRRILACEAAARGDAVPTHRKIVARGCEIARYFKRSMSVLKRGSSRNVS